MISSTKKERPSNRVAICAAVFLSLIIGEGRYVAADDRTTERIAILPVEFKDLKFSTGDRMDSLGTALETWVNAQHIKATVTVLDKVAIDEKFSVYGANTASRLDARLPEAAEKACRVLDARTDFSKIDHIIVLLAGTAESYGAGADHFWPQYIEFSIPLILDGKVFKAFASATEFAWKDEPCGPGDLCHETGHLLGLPDFYDTDGALSGGYGACFYGSLSVMDEGYRNALSLHPAGFGAAELFCLSAGFGTAVSAENHDPARHFSLEDISRSGRYLSFAVRDSLNILLEHRDGKGLLISRVDRSRVPAGTSSYWGKELTAFQRWNLNEVNCNPDYQCATALPAISGPQKEADVFFPKPGRDFWFDSQSPLAVIDITEASGQSDFRLLNPLSIVELSAIQNCAFIRLETEFTAEETDSCVFQYRQDGGMDDKRVKVISPAQSFSTTITGLKPDTGYKLTATIHDKKGRSYSRTANFHTDRIIKGVRPFIYLTADRNADGSFKIGTELPLQLYNCDAAHVEWTFDGKETENGVLLIQSSGVLQAAFTNGKGGRTVIRKTINAR